MGRPWVKLFCEPITKKFIHRVKDSKARAVFLITLCLAGQSAYEGCIQVAEGIGYTLTQLEALYLMPEGLNEALQVLSEANYIEIDSNNVIRLTHWSQFQTDFNRQKPYRLKSKAKKLQTKLQA